MRDSSPRAVALAPHLPRGDIPADVLVLEEAEVRKMIHHARRGTYADTRAEDPAYLLYTSGTTARPKGVVHAHRVALGRSRTYQGWYGIRPDDVMLHRGRVQLDVHARTGLIDPWRMA